MAPSKRKLAPNASPTAPGNVVRLGRAPKDLALPDAFAPVGNLTGRVRWASYEHDLRPGCQLLG